MKKIITIITILLTTISYAQNKNAKAAIAVDGVCMMCKERIEKSAIKTVGVKNAVWNMQTKQLNLIYDERKTDLKKISENIAAVGHDTKQATAPEVAYNKVDPCCKYRDEQVVKNHN